MHSALDGLVQSLNRLTQDCDLIHERLTGDLSSLADLAHDAVSTLGRLSPTIVQLMNLFFELERRGTSERTPEPTATMTNAAELQLQKKV